MHISLEDPKLELIIKHQHIGELIGVMEGYIKKMPQHKEYYDSIITHLAVVAQTYVDQIEKLTYLEETSCQIKPH